MLKKALGSSRFLGSKKHVKALGSNLFGSNKLDTETANKNANKNAKPGQSEIVEDSDAPPPFELKAPHSKSYFHNFKGLKGLKGAFNLSGILNFQKKFEKYFSTGGVDDGDNGPKYFYKLALQRIGDSRLFTIHGLWIHKFSDKMFTTRDAFEFNEKQFLEDLETANLLERLSENWPSKEKENSKLWENQWVKHGRHFRLAIASYFKLALNLYDKIPAQAKDLRLSPGEKEARVIIEELSRTLEDIYGKKAYPQIRCEKDGKGLFRLMEVWICLDSEEFKAIDCPKKAKTYIGCVATDTIHLY